MTNLPAEFRPRVRFAPSPTGFLHVGSARTFIFNWLYARHNNGTMILRIDDTDVERNTDASLASIFEGLQWLSLNWDEQYKQSERLNLHRQMAEDVLSGRLVTIGLSDDLFDLLRHQSADGDAVFRSDDLCAANRRLVELDREISSAHARILRAARKPRQSGQRSG